MHQILNKRFIKAIKSIATDSPLADDLDGLNQYLNINTKAAMPNPETKTKLVNGNHHS